MLLTGPNVLKFESDVLLEAVKFKELMDEHLYDKIFQVSLS